ncbi:hypothetical protein TA3x_001020 [Tundrisphaera sp. TA3]|uniref:hypothetical protein n=1 Tax=Tundrisphaera sp. TA3 TaxID=3435775 RepID=UPI003EB8B8B7
MNRPPAFNPYAAPASPGRPPTPHNLGLLGLAGLATCGFFASVVAGAATNAINVRVSPQYFAAIMGWRGVADIASAGIVQGIFEGMVIGAGLSPMFVGGVAWITRAGCSFGFALAHLLGILAGALLAWAIGGAAAVGLASLSPEWFRMNIRGVPPGEAELLRFAWVGGSILGIEVGGLLSVVAGLAALRENWRRRLSREIRFLG